MNNFKNNILQIDDQKSIKDALLERQVFVKFTKADGTLREMNCTTSIDAIWMFNNKKQIFNRDDDDLEISKTVSDNPNTQKVFDLNINEWRSFRWNRLISAEIL